jgi:hypothetical protein
VTRQPLMNDPIKLDYVRGVPKAGRSRFAIASICMAAVDYLFIALAGPPLYISPFESMGNEKEMKVATVAAVLGVVLAIRAMQDPKHKRGLAILGLVLNGLAIPAAWVFLPYL